MEVVIGILWYLHIMVVDVPYTTTQVNAMAQANQPVLTQIMSDSTQTRNIMTTFHEQTNLEQTGNIVEIWKEDEPQPIRN